MGAILFSVAREYVMPTEVSSPGDNPFLPRRAVFVHEMELRALYRTAFWITLPEDSREWFTEGGDFGEQTPLSPSGRCAMLRKAFAIVTEEELPERDVRPVDNAFIVADEDGRFTGALAKAHRIDSAGRSPNGMVHCFEADCAPFADGQDVYQRCASPVNPDDVRRQAVHIPPAGADERLRSGRGGLSVTPARCPAQMRASGIVRQ
jgi:hypothetical protein